MLLAEQGSHSWIGRSTDPDEADIARAEAGLQRAGYGGWIAVVEGDYWSSLPITVLEVRPLNFPQVAFKEAVDAFMEYRRQRLDCRA